MENNWIWVYIKYELGGEGEFVLHAWQGLEFFHVQRGVGICFWVANKIFPTLPQEYHQTKGQI